MIYVSITYIVRIVSLELYIWEQKRLSQYGTVMFGNLRTYRISYGKYVKPFERMCMHSSTFYSPSQHPQFNLVCCIVSERLETIGDSFLKYAVTSYLYCTFPTIHEGKLSHLRSKQVSNLNLYRLGREKCLGELMIATKFEPHDNWLPPRYHVPKHFEQALINSGVPETHWNMADLPDLSQLNTEEISAMIKEKNNSSHKAAQKQLENLPSFVPYNLLTQHSIPDKSIADCVEALIGAYLISCGQKGALLLMSWLGLTVLPKDESQEDQRRRILDLPIPKTPLLRSDAEGLRQLDYLLDGFDSFETLIGYRFKDRSYLLQAFSHASYYPNRLTDCYQRLEFLGDAVLDYLITRHLFEDERQHSPGTLTDLRSALVNNTVSTINCIIIYNYIYSFLASSYPFRYLPPWRSSMIFTSTFYIFHPGCTRL